MLLPPTANGRKPGENRQIPRENQLEVSIDYSSFSRLFVCVFLLSRLDRPLSLILFVGRFRI